jgi:hypothetical protein
MCSVVRRVLLTLGSGIMLFSSACSRDSLPTAEEQLVGRWEWVESTGEAPTSVTPASTGHTVLVDFDRRGRARFYEDGSLRSAAAFSVRRAVHGTGRKRSFRHMIIYRGYQSNQFYSVSGNRLLMEDATGQNGAHIYRRASRSSEAQVAATKLTE